MMIVRMKSGIIALLIEILISCLTQCCRIGSRAKTLINDNRLVHSDDDLKEYNSNQTWSSDNISSEEELNQIVTPKSTDIWRPIPRHIKNKQYDCTS